MILIALFLFFIYSSSSIISNRTYFDFFNCWLEKTSFLNTSTWAVVNCDGHFFLMFLFCSVLGKLAFICVLVLLIMQYWWCYMMLLMFYLELLLSGGFRRGWHIKSWLLYGRKCQLLTVITSMSSVGIKENFEYLYSKVKDNKLQWGWQNCVLVWIPSRQHQPGLSQ